MINLFYVRMLFYLSFFCTYSNKNKILSVLFEHDFQKIAKINSQQEKLVFPNRKN